jgi:hypothetical protein
MFTITLTVYDRNRRRDHGYYPHKAEIAEVADKAADRKAGPRSLL